MFKYAHFVCFYLFPFFFSLANSTKQVTIQFSLHFDLCM